MDTFRRNSSGVGDFAAGFPKESILFSWRIASFQNILIRPDLVRFSKRRFPRTDLIRLVRNGESPCADFPGLSFVLPRWPSLEKISPELENRFAQR